MTLKERMKQHKHDLVLQTLFEHGLHLGNTAAALGIHRWHIDRLMKDLGINIKEIRLHYAAAGMVAEFKGRQMEKNVAAVGPSRKRLPQTRASITHKFKIEGVRCYINAGLYENGQPGEIFLSIDKVGSVEHGFAESWAIAISMLLQYDVPLSVIVTKFSHMRFAPAGKTESSAQELKFASSIVDYVVRWLELKFLKGGNLPDVPSVEESKK